MAAPLPQPRSFGYGIFLETRTSLNLVPPSLVYKFLETNPLLQYYTILVVGLEHFFPYIGNKLIIPTDKLIFFRGVGIPPTSINTSTQT
jgi:hypothetical protein